MTRDRKEREASEAQERGNGPGNDGVPPARFRSLPLDGDFAGTALTDVPLGRRQVLAQFLCRSARTVAGGVALDTPLVEQMGHSGFGILVVTSDDQRAAILCASWFSISSKVSGINMIEGLDDLRGWQMVLQEFGRSGRLVVKLGNVTVTLRVVIVGVDDDFAR